MISAMIESHRRNALLFLGVVIVLLGIATPLRAQVLVDLSIKRTLYIAYEPLLATVRITNLSGNRLLLADVDGKKWFGFKIETLDGRPIPPADPDYQIQPIQIESGESISRTVNLTELYPLSDFGSYRINASVYSAELARYFSSPPLTVEITEGRLIWEQSVGVPTTDGGAGGTRTISLLTHRLPAHTDLYLRIEDKTAGLVYCTHRLGDFIAYGKPDIALDSLNNIYVLQNASPRLFIYSKVGLDGKILDRVSYQSGKVRPQLKRTADGEISVIGGMAFDPNATPTPAVIPKLSDRPLANGSLASGTLTPYTPPAAPEKSKTPAKSSAKPPVKNHKPAKSTPSPSPVKVD